MRVSATPPQKTDPKYDFIEQVDFDTLLAESDVISIHAPLTPSTEDTFDADAFAKMKDGTILIQYSTRWLDRRGSFGRCSAIRQSIRRRFGRNTG